MGPVWGQVISCFGPRPALPGRSACRRCPRRSAAPLKQHFKKHTPTHQLQHFSNSFHTQQRLLTLDISSISSFKMSHQSQKSHFSSHFKSRSSAGNSGLSLNLQARARLACAVLEDLRRVRLPASTASTASTGTSTRIITPAKTRWSAFHLCLLLTCVSGPENGQTMHKGWHG